MTHPHAARLRHHEECHAQALALMDTPRRPGGPSRGQEALDAGFYTEFFNWTFERLKAGNAPTGIPAKLLKEWEALGWYRMERVRKRAGK